jgi:hypothetical protein
VRELARAHDLRVRRNNTGRGPRYRLLDWPGGFFVMAANSLGRVVEFMRSQATPRSGACSSLAAKAGPRFCAGCTVPIC